LPSVTHVKQLTANTAPCALLGPRQNKVHWWETRWTSYLPCAVTGWHTANTAPLSCALAQAHGKDRLFAMCQGLDTRKKMDYLPCALAMHTAKNGTFAVCPGTRCISACIFLINSVYITPIKYTMTYVVHIYIDTNPENIRYESIQYSNQIHTIVDTNP